MPVSGQFENNPKRKKPWTYHQAATKKDQAERFVRDVVEDGGRADELAEMSVEDYAAGRGKEIVANPTTRRDTMHRKISNEQQQECENPVTKAMENASRLAAEEQNELRHRIRELENDIESLQGKLDAISEVLDCDDPDCAAEGHLEEIEEILNESEGE